MRSCSWGVAVRSATDYRCHGTDATGSELAPDLRMTLNSGMKQQTFMAVAMAGREDKGMPKWAGFLDPEDMIKIYRYVKARSLDLVPSGRRFGRRYVLRTFGPHFGLARYHQPILFVGIVTKL